MTHDHHTTDAAIKAYVRRLVAGLQASTAADEYQRELPDNHIIYPATVQFLVASNAFMFVFVGQDRARSPRIPIYRTHEPFQQVAFGERPHDGAAAITFARPNVVVDGLVFAQRRAIERFPDEVEKVGGARIVGDRLFDVTSEGEVTLLDCFFHFVRNCNYESLCQELIFVSGDFAQIQSEAAIRDRIHRLSDLLAERVQERAIPLVSAASQ